MKKILVALALAVSVAACGEHAPQQQYVQQPAPQVQQYQQPPVQQYAAPQQGISTGTAVLGAAAIGAGAYYLGKNSAPTKTETKTVVVQQPAPTQYNYRPGQATPQAKAFTSTPAPKVTSSASTFKPVAASKAVTVTPPRRR